MCAIKNFIFGLRLSKDEKYFARDVYHWDYVTHVKYKKLAEKHEKLGILRLHTTFNLDFEDNNRFIRLCTHPFYFFMAKLRSKKDPGCYDEEESIQVSQRLTEELIKEGFTNEDGL